GARVNRSTRRSGSADAAVERSEAHGIDPSRSTSTARAGFGAGCVAMNVPRPTVDVTKPAASRAAYARTTVSRCVESSRPSASAGSRGSTVAAALGLAEGVAVAIALGEDVARGGAGARVFFGDGVGSLELAGAVVSIGAGVAAGAALVVAIGAALDGSDRIAG